MAVERTELDWILEQNSRAEYRVAVLLKWAEERPGHGRGDDSQRYRYNVETFADGGVIYLHRPARLNKGCDFIVLCEPQIPRDDGFKYKNPRHQDLIQEAKSIANELGDKKLHFVQGIEDVALCRKMDAILQSINLLEIDAELLIRIERCLKVAKWLFIEQDITDWNTSGRKMLVDAIQNSLKI
jgi:hypothetical protein